MFRSVSATRDELPYRGVLLSILWALKTIAPVEPFDGPTKLHDVQRQEGDGMCGCVSVR